MLHLTLLFSWTRDWAITKLSAIPIYNVFVMNKNEESFAIYKSGQLLLYSHLGSKSCDCIREKMDVATAPHKGDMEINEVCG